MRARVSIENPMPSAPAEGKERSRKIILKAANDNHPPLSFILKKVFFYGLPITGILSIAALLYFG